ncbi:Holliday junction resolvase RecU [Niameybacter massiliensis]|uniref:Holliday junction resolvase RecU n=1 Tax=Niameybacter massiliensis TaxID=1658108 RepID=UPI0006B572E1|nr:Holliday junction resolvase RecU [Niameybacter massiliensis]
MAYWNTRGLRGSVLEETINTTNEKYRELKLAMVQKIPTPIKPITIDKTKGVITLAYFDQKSTVDYIGVAQGTPICFDAKETTKEALPLANIHLHQIEFMEDFQNQGGEAFLIVYFKKYDRYFLFTLEEIKKYYNIAVNGGRKSIPYAAFNTDYEIFIEGGLYLNYLKPLAKYIQDKDV